MKWKYTYMCMQVRFSMQGICFQARNWLYDYHLFEVDSEDVVT